jgi:ribulose-5-phosphate 4-epimerase/fuculose-1-phosphate aldolase
MITAIGDVMRRAYDKGWITTRDGNISLRRSRSSTMYITPSGWRKTIIHPEHMLKCRINPKGSEEPFFVINDLTSKPSGEIQMHYLLQRGAIKTRAVVHLHPTNIIAAMYAGWNLQSLASQFPEVSRYTKVGPSVPVLPATSQLLADVTYENFVAKNLDQGLTYNIVGQANHGVCAVGDNPWDAYEHIERLEHICEIVLKSGVTPSQEI